MAVHFEAGAQAWSACPGRPAAAAEVLRERGHLFLPLVVIVGTLLSASRRRFAALCGIFSVVPTACCAGRRARSSPGPADRRAPAGAINAVIVAMACASAGIVIGVIAQTGLGLTFTGVVLARGPDSLLLALLLTMVAGIILGMGMPTTPAYIVQVALLVPALVKLGVPVESAHLFVLLLRVLSAITPPVAIAVYAACGIARGSCGDQFTAVKLGATGYIIPFMFVFGPRCC